MNERLFKFLSVVTLIWTFILLVMVAVVQKPEGLFYLPTLLPHQVADSSPRIAALLAVGWSIAVAALVAASSLALGQLLLLPLPLPGRSPWLGAWLVGLGVQGTIWYLLAAVAVPAPWVAVLLLGAPLLLWLVRRPTLGFPPLSRRARLVIGVVLLVSFLRALLPDYSWDGRFYHLVVPMAWIENGQATMWQEAPHFHFPHLVESLFLPALLLADDGTAKLLHWLFFPLILALLWELADGHEAQQRGEWALLLAASIPMLPLLAGWAYSDVALAAFTLGTVWAMERWRQAGGQWLAIAGAMAGFALGVKYLAFIVPLAALGLLLYWGTRQPRPYLQLVLSATLAGGTWYLRNLLVTGNPVYPFVLGGAGWDEFRAAWYRMAGTGIGLDLTEWLQLPLNTTLGLRDANFYDGQMGPLFLGLLPLALWLAVQDRRQGRTLPPGTGSLLLVAGLLIALWLAGIMQSSALWQSRFLLPPLLLLVPLLAWTIEKFRAADSPTFAISFLARSLVWFWITLALLFGLIDLLSLRPLPVLLGGESRAAWLERVIGSPYTSMQAMDQLPPEARVLLLYEPRSLGARRPTQPDPILDQFAWRLHRAQQNLAEVAAEMRAEGFTHLLLHRRGAELAAELHPALHSPDQLDALDRFLQQQATLRWESPDGAYQIYELKGP